MSDKELLLERLERLAMVLDEIMPGCAELVRDAITILKEHEADRLDFIFGFREDGYSYNDGRSRPIKRISSEVV